jgi:riboflavin biosynthesis pyrimidine reductase
MTQVVEHVTAGTGLGELAPLYADAPDGVRVNMIMSADGAVAFHGLVGPLSNACDQNLLLALRGYADVVLVGAGTVRAERYGPVRLTPAQLAERRDRWGITDIPPIAVVTRSGDLPASLFAEHTQRPLLITTTEVVRTHPQLRDRADVLTAGATEVDISAAIDRLQARGFRRVLCEGGPTLLDELISADLVDEMCLTLSPTLAAAKPVRRAGVPLRDPARLSLQHACTIDDYVYLRYRRARR